MIALKPVTAPVSLPCPKCSAPLLSVGANRLEVNAGTSRASRILNMHACLDEARRVPNGFQCLLETGKASCCGETFLLAEAVLVNCDLRPDAEDSHYGFVGTYFFFNGDRGQPGHFLASHGKQEWIVQRFESELGPVLHHYLGPLSSVGGEADQVQAHRLLLALWDDLRALTAATV